MAGIPVRCRPWSGAESSSSRCSSSCMEYCRHPGSPTSIAARSQKQVFSKVARRHVAKWLQAGSRKLEATLQLGVCATLLGSCAGGFRLRPTVIAAPHVGKIPIRIDLNLHEILWKLAHIEKTVACKPNFHRQASVFRAPVCERQPQIDGHRQAAEARQGDARDGCPGRITDGTH